MQRCSDAEMFPGWCREMHRDTEMQHRCIDVEVQRCGSVEGRGAKFSGGAEVLQRLIIVIGAEVHMQRRCSIE